MEAVRLDGELAGWGRLPDPERGVEATLERLLTRSRGEAIDRTSARFAGLDLLALARPVDGRTLAVHHLEPDTLDMLVGARFVDTYLAGQRADSPFVKQVVPGVGATDLDPALVRSPPSPALQPQGVPGGIADAMRRGCSFVIHRVEQYFDGPVQDMFRDLDLVFTCGVGANCYVSRDGGEGFGVHWDDHDVLVLHLDGRKMWEVFAPTQLSPLPDFVQSHAVGAPIWSGIVEPGTVLYIPRGFPHRVEGLAEMSVHLTVAINRPTMLDFVGRHLGAAEAPSEVERLVEWVTDQFADAEAAADIDRRRLSASLLVRHRCALSDVDLWRQQADEGHPELDRLEPLLPATTVVDTAPNGDVRFAWNGLMVEMTSAEVDLLDRWPDIEDAERPRAAALGLELLKWGLAMVRPATSAPPDGARGTVAA